MGACRTTVETMSTTRSPRLRPAVLCVLVLIAPAGFAATPVGPERVDQTSPAGPQVLRNAAVVTLLRQAARAVERRELDQATATLERALRIDPRDAEVWRLLARVRRHQGETEQAEAMLAKAATLDRSAAASSSAPPGAGAGDASAADDGRLSDSDDRARRLAVSKRRLEAVLADYQNRSENKRSGLARRRGRSRAENLDELIRALYAAALGRSPERRPRR